jgi:hypothetical protein
MFERGLGRRRRTVAGRSRLGTQEGLDEAIASMKGQVSGVGAGVEGEGSWELKDLVTTDAFHPGTFLQRVFFVPVDPKTLSADSQLRWRRWRVDDMILFAALVVYWRVRQAVLLDSLVEKRGREVVRLHGMPPGLWSVSKEDCEIMERLLHHSDSARVRCRMATDGLVRSCWIYV